MNSPNLIDETSRDPSPIVYVVDDDPSFLTSIGDLLRASDYRVALYDSAAGLLERPPIDEPACILLDVQMADLSGPQLQDHLVNLGSKLPIIFVTGYGDIPTSVRTIKAGAEDFLTKPVAKDQLLETIKRALVRGEEARDRDSRLAALRSLVSQLTPREYDVFTLLARGNLHKQIAYALGISERTVKFHRHNVLQKFDVHSLADLVVIAERLGMLPDSCVAAIPQSPARNQESAARQRIA
jgi:FixJ family two-component response regulator